MMPAGITPEELHNIYAAEEQFWWYQGMRAISTAFLNPLSSIRLERGLEAGCGTGYNALEFERLYGCQMVGMDLEPLALLYGRKRNFKRSLRGSIKELPFPAECFDLVTCFDVLLHLPPGEEPGPLAEFARVLRPGGWLVLRVAAFNLLRSRHSQFVSERQRFRAGPLLRLIARCGLQTVRWSYANSFLSPIALVKFRIVEPLLGTEPHSGVEAMPPAWLNRLLKRVLLCEAALIRRGCRFVFGQSLLILAQKTASSHNA
ncbi:MAG: class I SAM-dependent methyltransferase [Acidobacteria bacterium]|nr:class I SAM-dependent methyltransferase [Acidobacteriota bacterium]